MKRFLSAFCGLAASLTIIFPQIGLLEWVLFVPFALLCIEEKEKTPKSFRREYFSGFLFFFAFYLVCYSWLISMYPLSVTGMSRLSALGVVLFAWIGIPMFQSVGFALIIPLFKAARRKGLPRFLWPIFMGAAWCIGEWCQNFFWYGVPWVKLAIGQTEMPVLLQGASLFGSYFVTFLIISVNFYIALAIKATAKKRKVFALAAALIFASNTLFGFFNLAFYSNATYKTVRVSALQGNISGEDKWNSTYSNTMKVYRDLCEKSSEAGAKYALLPETAIPYVIEDNPFIDSDITDMACSNELNLFVGLFGRTEGGLQNAIRVYDASSEVTTTYAKRILVPFGEYIPMRELFISIVPALEEINMINRALLGGNESTVWGDGDVTFGFMICFDSIYDYIARESVLKGAEILMISTNDSWFGDSVGTAMHNAQAKLRAIENGRSVVRSANTGISSIILPTGEVVCTLKVGEKGLITADIPINNRLTLYTRIGNLFVYICIVFLGVVFLFSKKMGTFWSAVRHSR